MGFREKHRLAAFRRRYERHIQNLPVDPSNRARAATPLHQCPCGRNFRQPFQLQIHVGLRHTSDTTDVLRKEPASNG